MFSFIFVSKENKSHLCLSLNFCYSPWMLNLRFFFLASFLTLNSWTNTWAVSQADVSFLNFLYTPVGVEYIHSPPPGARVSAYVPLPALGQGHIEDFNAYSYYKKYPQKFTLSDGTLLTPFIYVDVTPYSTLKKLIRKYAEQISNTNTAQYQQINILRDFVSKQILNMVPENDPIVRYFAEKNYSFPEFQQTGSLKPGHFPLATNFNFQTVRLEDIIKYGRGFCIHKVLVTSLIMKELKIPHAIRFGSSGLEGHDWIELPDGRILDPTWNLVVYPDYNNPINKGWFWLDHTGVYKYDFFPFAVWKN